MSHDPRWFAEPLPLKDYPTSPEYPSHGCRQVEQILQASRLDPTSALAWRTRAGWRIPYRRQPCSYLWIVLEGKGSMMIDGVDRSFDVAPNDCFVVPEQVGHELEPTKSAKFRVLIFHFLFRYLGAFDLFALLDLRGPIRHPQPGRNEVATQLCRTYAQQLPGWRPVLRAGLLYLLYPELCNAAHRIGDSLGDLGPPGIKRLLPAFVHLRQNAHRHDLRVGDIAASAGISEVYLRKLFRQCLNRTPNEFLVEERLARAKDMLSHTEATVGHIAASVGFENSSYFHRVFKRHFGISPGAFRRHPIV